MPRYITKDKVEQIIKLYKSKKFTRKQISKALNISTTTIIRIIIDAGIKRWDGNKNKILKIERKKKRKNYFNSHSIILYYNK